jgi:hypothetical protein
MLLMDRENLLVPGYSHVLSSGNDVGELEELRMRVGAPPRALHLRAERPHLDLKLGPRELALSDPGVRVFRTTRELILFWQQCQEKGTGSRERGTAEGEARRRDTRP